MKDFLGNELNIGDQVVFVSGANTYSYLAQGTVMKFYKSRWNDDECTVDSKTHVTSERIMKLKE